AVDVDGEGLLPNDLGGDFADATAPDGDVGAHRVAILARIGCGTVARARRRGPVAACGRGRTPRHPADRPRRPFRERSWLSRVPDADEDEAVRGGGGAGTSAVAGGQHLGHPCDGPRPATDVDG